MTKEHIGYIGLGEMGGPMAANLASAGYEVLVLDTDAEKMHAAVKAGCKAVATPAELARQATVLITCLPSGDVVDQVLRGEHGLLAGAQPDSVLVDMTTNYPERSTALAEELAGQGLAMLDAPMSGGNHAAKAGNLSFMVGGPQAVFDRCLPVLEVLGKHVALMGTNVGAGGYAKLANQILVYVNLASVVETVAFAEKTGVDLAKLLPALAAGIGGSAMLDWKTPKVLARDFSPDGPVWMAHKDLGMVRQAMAAHGFELPHISRVYELMHQLAEADRNGEDHLAMLELVEREVGL